MLNHETYCSGLPSPEVWHPRDNLKPGSMLTFEQFSPFVSFAGLSEDWAKELNELLRELFNRTKDLWRPGFCMFSAKIAETVVEIMPTARIHLRHYCLNHTWSELTLPNSTPFIIDPAGILDPGLTGTILPYFGIAENCQLKGVPRKLAQHIYLNGKPYLHGEHSIILSKEMRGSSFSNPLG